ncbi:MAG TPA: type II secretion system F family protein [Acidimicrobiia bacterium]|nr:type II secretion system F family protein [Acidimicrobiia bacterium]
MSVSWIAAATSVAVAAAAMATSRVVYPTRATLRSRVGPYLVAPRTAPGDHVDLESASVAGASSRRRSGREIARSLLLRGARVIDARGDEDLASLLARAGLYDVSTEAFRVRRMTDALVVGGVATAFATATTRSPLLVVVSGIAGFAYGSTRTRRRVERATVARAERLRQELVTINQLLAIHVRTGAGPMHAVRRVVDRGSGVVVEELAAVLRWTRAGTRDADAFRRAAEITADPSAARTYLLIATAVERGADLGAALLALSHDIRDARREALHQQAIRRRAAMLLPTIGILAPIMLLFIAAPLPSMVLGAR